MKIDLRKYLGKIKNYFWKNKTIFGKERLLETLSVLTDTSRAYTCLGYAHAGPEHAHVVRVP